MLNEEKISHNTQVSGIPLFTNKFRSTCIDLFMRYIFRSNGTFFFNKHKTVIEMPSRHFIIMKGNYANNMIKMQT